jgi:LysM repeat protein
MQILFGRRGPMDLGMQQPGQALPTAKLDRVKYVTHCWNLLRHVTQSNDSPFETLNGLKKKTPLTGLKEEARPFGPITVTAEAVTSKTAQTIRTSRS